MPAERSPHRDLDAWARWRPPSQCEICRRWAARRLCTPCVTRFAPALQRCDRCALPVAGGVNLCGDCAHQPPPFTRSICAVDYRFPWDRLMADFKFHGRPELGDPLSALLLQAWRDDANAPPQPDLFLPVPLSPARLAERGYNQAWELARRLARGLDRPALASGLVRVFETERQAELSRDERQNNLKAAFLVEPGLRTHLRGRHLGLVDDVMTTGATAREVSATLLRAGAGRVDLWVVARTPAS